MSLYHDLIIDHYKNPRNFGVLENPDLIAQEANASCGDLIEFQIKVVRDKSHLPALPTAKPLQAGESRTQANIIISAVAWRGVGCAISTAAASLLSERVKSQESRVKSILRMTDNDMVKLLGGDISPTRLKCATLSLKALKKAFKQSNAKI